jgi:hypothetical protein
MASKILVDELAPQSHATDVTLTTGKNITGANTQFKITGGSSGNHLSTDGAGALSWVSPPGQGLAGAYTWRMESDYTTSGTSGTVLGNSVVWSLDDTAGYASIGSTGGIASGVHTFGDTGIWRIDLYTSWTISTTAPWELVKLETSKNTGGSWTIRSQGAMAIHNGEYGSGTVSCIFDCENTTTDLFRIFTISGSSNNNVIFQGDANINYTYLNFTKLGDT